MGCCWELLFQDTPHGPARLDETSESQKWGCGTLGEGGALCECVVGSYSNFCPVIDAIHVNI